MTDVTEIIKAVLYLIIALISCFLIPYIKSRTTQKQQENMEYWVNKAVTAAEQIIKERGMGAKKNVIVKEFLNDHGFDANLEEIDCLIESAVHELGDKHDESN